MKLRKLDQMLEQCIEEADFAEADMDLNRLNKLCEEALNEPEESEEEIDTEEE